MRTQTLSRLSAFLAKPGPAQVVAPSLISQPVNYTARLLHRLQPNCKAVLASSAVALLMCGSPAQSHTVKGTQASSEKGLEAITQIYKKFASHGRTDTTIQMQVVADDAEGDPLAHIGDIHVCKIEGLRMEYSDYRELNHFESQLAREFVVIHEDMHCRTMPHIVAQARFDMNKGITLSSAYPVFVRLFAEASADAMAVLMKARRDGVDAALTMAEQVEAARIKAGFQHYDTIKTLEIVRTMLHSDKSVLKSDAAAFSASIRAGLQGTSMTLPQWLPPEQLREMESAEFRDSMSSLATGLYSATRAYHAGNHHYLEVLGGMKDVASSQGSLHSLNTVGVVDKTSLKREWEAQPVAQRVREDIVRTIRQSHRELQAGVVKAIARTVLPSFPQPAEPVGEKDNGDTASPRY